MMCWCLVIGETLKINALAMKIVHQINQTFYAATEVIEFLCCHRNAFAYRIKSLQKTGALSSAAT